MNLSRLYLTSTAAETNSTAIMSQILDQQLHSSYCGLPQQTSQVSELHKTLLTSRLSYEPTGRRTSVLDAENLDATLAERVYRRRRAENPKCSLADVEAAERSGYLPEQSVMHSHGLLYAGKSNSLVKMRVKDRLKLQVQSAELQRLQNELRALEESVLRRRKSCESLQKSVDMNRKQLSRLEVEELIQ